MPVQLPSELGGLVGDLFEGVDCVEVGVGGVVAGVGFSDGGVDVEDL